jgi:hypothetical protein
MNIGVIDRKPFGDGGVVQLMIGGNEGDGA